MLLPNLRVVYEKLANFALNSDHTLYNRLKPHAGKVVRIKTSEPYAVFYLMIRDHDLFVTSTYDGDEDVRCRMPMKTLIYVAFGFEKLTTYNRDIKMEGDGDLIFDLMKGFETSNLWQVFKSVFGMFVPELTSVDDFVKLIVGKEPAWVARFNCIPEVNREMLEVLKSLQEIQSKQYELNHEIQKEIVNIKKHNFGMIVIMTFLVLQFAFMALESKIPFQF